jgi:uncharacterized membrane protein YdfJ with MMPL/SSD domain
MSTAGKSHNLAARMGRWSSNNWKTATFGWLAFVLVAFGLGGLAGLKTIDSNDPGPGESGRMDRILDEGFKQPAAESVFIQSDSLEVTDPAFKQVVEDVVKRIATLGVVQNVQSPLDPENAEQIAASRRAALVDFEIRGDPDKAVDKIGPVLDRVAVAQQMHPEFFVGEFGDASAVDAIDGVVGDDLAKAGELSLPITLAILVLVFGALVAAGIPLVLALTAVFGTFGLVTLSSHIVPTAQQTPAVVLLVGLAVGVDYSMFYLKRAREERAAGRSIHASVEAAAATSGRSVLISGLTVMIAMAGMFVTGDKIFESFAIATITVVAMAVLGSLTVLPALLCRFGDGVDRLRVPFLGRRRDDGQGGAWRGIVGHVMSRPVLWAALSGGLLIALAIPAAQLRLQTAGPDTFPQSLALVQTYNRMQDAFPGSTLPANVVVQAPDVNAPTVQTAIDDLEQRALATGRMHDPITVDVNEDGTVANISIPTEGEGSDSVSAASLNTLREDIVPETVGALPDVEAGVTGLSARWIDMKDAIRSELPAVFAFVLLFAFVLMLLAFRSLVIAAKAILLNLLSVAASYGVLVLVFQHGVGKGLLGFSSTAGIDPVIPLLLFVILFGLSMDYHVFILSRIREAFNRGMGSDEAIAYGIGSTAAVVTSAAIVMVAVFAVFATLSMLFFKQFGVGLAVAVLLDATIVRAVLLPATMKLLGDWNWYLPSWLQWLPHLDPDEAEVAPETKPTPVSA